MIQTWMDASENWDTATARDKPYLFLSITALRWVVGTYCVLLLPFIALIGQLLTLHVWLNFHGLTTFDWIMKMRAEAKEKEKAATGATASQLKKEADLIDSAGHSQLSSGAASAGNNTARAQAAATAAEEAAVSGAATVGDGASPTNATAGPVSAPLPIANANANGSAGPTDVIGQSSPPFGEPSPMHLPQTTHVTVTPASHPPIDATGDAKVAGGIELTSPPAAINSAAASTSGSGTPVLSGGSGGGNGGAEDGTASGIARTPASMSAIGTSIAGSGTGSLRSLPPILRASGRSGSRPNLNVNAPSTQLTTLRPNPIITTAVDTGSGGGSDFGTPLPGSIAGDNSPAPIDSAPASASVGFGTGSDVISAGPRPLQTPPIGMRRPPLAPLAIPGGGGLGGALPGTPPIRDASVKFNVGDTPKPGALYSNQLAVTNMPSTAGGGSGGGAPVPAIPRMPSPSGSSSVTPSPHHAH